LYSNCRLYVLAHELEADAGRTSSSHNTPPAVHAAGPNTPLATYLLPEMVRGTASLLEFGAPAFLWLAARNNLSTADKYGVKDTESQAPKDGGTFARVFRPSPQMVSLAPSPCCVQLFHTQGNIIKKLHW
jgi:hypothetical protein